MTKKDLTELVFIVDRSGSMGGMESDTIGGINATLAKHASLDGECTASVVLFDDATDVLFDRMAIADVPRLTEADYQVRGCTALLDAVGGSIRHIERVHGYLPEELRPEHTVFVITTDGQENASRRYGYDEVRRAIERKREQGWEFLFLGAHIDAVGEAARIGIHADRAATYVNDSVGAGVMYDAVANATCAMRSAPTASVGSSWKAGVERDTARRGGGRGLRGLWGLWGKR